MDKSFLKRLADSNLSIIPVSADKRPLGQINYTNEDYARSVKFHRSVGMWRVKPTDK